MDELNYTKKFFNNNYLELLLDKNITIINFSNKLNITFVVYKDEIFIFESCRSLNQAYIFYNGDNNICFEGLEYYKITRNYLEYLSNDNINIVNGKTFSTNKIKYLISYFSKGYKNNKIISLKKIDKLMFNLLEFSSLLLENDIQTTSSNEYTALVTMQKDSEEYKIDFYITDNIEPAHITNRFGINQVLNKTIINKSYSNKEARTGLFFIDGYKDCFSLLETSTGCFLYYALDGEALYLKKYHNITKEDIYNFYTEIFIDDELPVTLTTDNVFLYDLLKKTFTNTIDFIYDKSNRYCRLISELAIVLALNNYDEYNINAFCMIIENNYNSISDYIVQMKQYDFEKMIEDCLNAYRYPDDFDIEEDDFEFDTFESEEDIVDLEVDTKLIS